MTAHGPVPDIWLFTGLPGAGKSTVARALGERMDRSAHLDGQAIWRQIIAGRVDPGPELEGESERQYELTVRNQCLLARSYAEAGFVPLIESVITTRHHLDAYRNYLMGGRLRLVVLAPRPEVTTARDAARGGSAGKRFHHLDAVLRRELADAGLWLDTSDLDPIATVDTVLAEQDQALLR